MTNLKEKQKNRCVELSILKGFSEVECGRPFSMNGDKLFISMASSEGGDLLELTPEGSDVPVFIINKDGEVDVEGKFLLKNTLQTTLDSFLLQVKSSFKTLCVKGEVENRNFVFKGLDNPEVINKWVKLLKLEFKIQ